MKTPNELKQYVLFQLNECGAVKEYLEDMALKGWRLKYIKKFYYFEKIEPQPLYYAVEVFSKASIYDTVPSDTAHEYIDCCRQAGWEFVCASGQINVFVSDSKDTVPIETDERLKFKTIKKSMLKQSGITWFAVFPIFLLNVILDFFNFESLVTMNIKLLSLLLHLMFFTVVIIQIVEFITWTFKQRKRLRQGKPIQYISKSNRRKKTIILLIPLGIMICAVFMTAAYSFIAKDYMTTVLAGITVPFVFVAFFRTRFFLQQKINRTINKAFALLIGFGLSVGFVFATVALFLVFNPVADNSSEDALRVNKTLLASSTTYAYISGIGVYKEITVFKSDHAWIVNQYIYTKIHLFFASDYTKLDATEWNAQAAYISGDKQYIQYENCVISFWNPPTLTQKERTKIKAFMDK